MTSNDKRVALVLREIFQVVGQHSELAELEGAEAVRDMRFALAVALNALGEAFLRGAVRGDVHRIETLAHAIADGLEEHYQQSAGLTEEQLRSAWALVPAWAARAADWVTFESAVKRTAATVEALQSTLVGVEQRLADSPVTRCTCGDPGHDDDCLVREWHDAWRACEDAGRDLQDLLAEGRPAPPAEGSA